MIVAATLGHVSFFAGHFVAIPHDTARTRAKEAVQGKNNVGYRTGVSCTNDNPGFLACMTYDY